MNLVFTVQYQYKANGVKNITLSTSFLSFRRAQTQSKMYRTSRQISVPYTEALAGSNLDQTLLKSMVFGPTKNVVANMFPEASGHRQTVSFSVENGSTYVGEEYKHVYIYWTLELAFGLHLRFHVVIHVICSKLSANYYCVIRILHILQS